MMCSRLTIILITESKDLQIIGIKARLLVCLYREVGKPKLTAENGDCLVRKCGFENGCSLKSSFLPVLLLYFSFHRPPSMSPATVNMSFHHEDAAEKEDHQEIQDPKKHSPSITVICRCATFYRKGHQWNAESLMLAAL
jgi:hypothetical protein